MSDTDIITSVGDRKPPETMNSPPKYHWEKEISGTKYTLSNDKSQLNISLFNQAFASEDVYWTGPMSQEALEIMIQHSCLLGLYTTKSHHLEANRNIPHSQVQVPVQIGFGRLVTDYSTVAYLSDVYILPEYQGKGLGNWMMACMKEIIDSLPGLRRAMLLTDTKGKGVKFYERELGMKVCDTEKDKFGFMQYVPAGKH